MAFRKATLTGTKALMCLYSESGGGKTLSALLIARGLAGPDGRIAMIDTENRRGEMYADDPRIGGYDVSQLEAPFRPKRYIEMIDEAERDGYAVIVIDSGSHAWEGEGGVLDMAVEKAGGGQPQFGHWKEPKTEHKHLIQRLQRCKAHVIVCLRAQYKSRQIDQKDFEKNGIQSRARSVVIRDDYQSPIQDERFIFEVTVHAQMSNTNPGVPIITKCPEMLLPAFPPGERITVETGRRMAEFYDKGAPVTAAADTVAEDARAAAEKGVEAYRAFFEALSPTAKRDLVASGLHDRLKAEAAAPPAEAPDDDFPGDAPMRQPGDADYIPPQFDD